MGVCQLKGNNNKCSDKWHKYGKQNGSRVRKLTLGSANVTEPTAKAKGRERTK